MEHKAFPALTTKVDEDQGIVEQIVAVMGNLDLGDDIIHNGAFAKTLAERGPKIRVLDQHNTHSIMNVIGKPLLVKEVGRDELPARLLQKYPEASGGLFTRTQYLMDTPEGKGAFLRIKAGAIDEASIGFDPVDVDFSQVSRGGQKRTARNLRTVKLYEYSPVIWGMNDATMALSAKSAGETDTPKPGESVTAPPAPDPEPIHPSVKAVWEARWEEAKQGQRLNREMRRGLRQMRQMIEGMLAGYDDEETDEPEQAARRRKPEDTCSTDTNKADNPPVASPVAAIEAEEQAGEDTHHAEPERKAGPGTQPPTPAPATDEPRAEGAGPDVTPPTSSEAGDQPDDADSDLLAEIRQQADEAKAILNWR